MEEWNYCYMLGELRILFSFKAAEGCGAIKISNNILFFSFLQKIVQVKFGNISFLVYFCI